MPNNKTLGDRGEKMAADYLMRSGYSIIQTNYRTSHLEIDIIAQQGKTLVFIEVKSRSTHYFGYPENAVNSKKKDHLINAANDFIHSWDWKGDIRFDIISILLQDNLLKELEHIKDAF